MGYGKPGREIVWGETNNGKRMDGLEKQAFADAPMMLSGESTGGYELQCLTSL